ncbi:hypothetical protein ACLOJK_034074 [Asimina triloba]
MDSPESQNGGKRGGFAYYVIRCSFTIVFSLIVSSLFSFLCGILAILIGNSSVPGSASVATECKIVSSGVDIRSSKVWAIPENNLNEIRITYPQHIIASAQYLVEYREDYSGQTLHAMAEAPKEALPLHCRPSFSAVLLTKDKFKVTTLSVRSAILWVVSAQQDGAAWKMDSNMDEHPDETAWKTDGNIAGTGIVHMWTDISWASIGTGILHCMN